jgi:hypothetical protein
VVQTQSRKTQLAQVQMNAVIGPRSRNPDINQKRMHEEIKKNCISSMTDQHFDAFHAIQNSVLTESADKIKIQEINVGESWLEGPYVRFFEQAFEWEQMTWILYPYFWGRKANWHQRVDYQDDDPAFEEFIKAGYARVNVPIRLGFENAIDYYLTKGKPWEGGPLPGLSSPTFVSLADEIQERLGRSSNEPTPYGEPWPVRVPTNLIKLRLDDDTPQWEKLNGKWTPKT